MISVFNPVTRSFTGDHNSRKPSRLARETNACVEPLQSPVWPRLTSLGQAALHSWACGALSPADMLSKLTE
ncbi:hypothetical protein SRHO_G00311910 [Serrasalmus rhombeus]